MKKIYFLVVVLILGNVAISQPWTYDFGIGTGTFISTTASTAFLPTPTSGTARVRVGTNPGSFVLANPGLASLGTNTELQFSSNTGSSSTSKFSIYDYTNGKTGYVKFKIAFSGGTNGVYKFSLGDGANFSDNNAIGTAQIFAGIEWTLGASNAITYRVLNAATYGTTGITNSNTQFVQSTSTVYEVEVYANNTTSSTNYTRSSTTYSLAPSTWDLWVDGTLVGDDLAKGSIGSDVIFDSYAFNHQSSATAPGTLYLDDLEYSNALPLPVPTTTSISPSSATAGGAGFTLTIDGTNFINGLSTVRWDGTNRTTTFVNSTQLTATINAADIVTAGSVSVDVLTTGNPTASNAQTFTIDPATSPTITLTPTSLTGFTYVAGSGPSTLQSFSVSGSNLTSPSGNILVNATGTDYEVYDLATTSWVSSFNIPYATATLGATNVDVRLKAGLAVGSYNGQLIVVSGGGDSKNETVSGSVTLGTPVAVAPTVFTATSFTASWGIVAGASAGYFLDVSTSPTFETSTPANDLYISEYVEGSSSNKYIEIYNGTGANVDLSNYELQLFTNGSPTVSTSVVLSGILTNGSTIVYKNSSATVYGGTATSNSAVNFNGDDAVALYKISTTSFVDIFGTIGEDPGSAWTAAGGYSTADKTLRRKTTVTGGITSNPGIGFPTLSTEWDLYDIDDVSNLGSHTFNSSTPSYLLGYNNLPVAGISQAVTVPGPGTYYFRIRATDGVVTSPNSNVISVVMNDQNAADFRTTGSGDYDAAGTWGFNVSTSFYTPATQKPTALNNVLVQNAHTVTLTGNEQANILTLATSSYVILSSNNLFVNNTAGGSATGYIQTNGTGALTVTNITTPAKQLPVGNSTYNPLQINNGSGFNWTARVEDAVNNVVGPFTTDKAINRTWHISPSATVVSAPDVTFNFDDADNTQLVNNVAYNGDAVRTVQVWHYGNGSWTAAGTSLAMTPVNGSQSLTLSGYTNFSPFAISKTSSPLPVTILSFAGQKEGSVNKLSWSTANEFNNTGFEILRSTDGITYTVIGFVNSLAVNGNSSDVLNYSFTDIAVSGTKQYYRLRQVDFDNRSNLSTIVFIKGERPLITSIDGVFPNPASSSVNVLIAASEREKVTLVVSDISGRVVSSKVVSVEQGSNTIPMDINQLNKGSYLISLVCENGCNSAAKFMKL